MSEQNQPDLSQPNQTQPPSQIKGTEGVELRVIIREKGNGDPEVQWQATLINSEVIIPLRPAHLLGLFQAAILVLGKDIYWPKQK